jgi:hypothetical protein
MVTQPLTARRSAAQSARSGLTVAGAFLAAA